MLIWLGKQYLGQKDKPDADKPNETTQPGKVSKCDLSILTDEELEEYTRILEKICGQSTESSGEKHGGSPDTPAFQRKGVSRSV